jgi:hypothetical protein
MTFTHCADFQCNILLYQGAKVKFTSIKFELTYLWGFFKQVQVKQVK